MVMCRVRGFRVSISWRSLFGGLREQGFEHIGANVYLWTPRIGLLEGS